MNAWLRSLGPTQQVGLLFTTVTNSGFITGLYVIVVPILGLLIGQRSSAGIWLGASLAVVGMFLLSGLQLIMMGVIGTYLGRVYVEAKDRPLYSLALTARGPRDDAPRGRR